MDLRELAEAALKEAGRSGASQAEVFASVARTVSVYVDDGRIKNAEEKSDQGIAVRALKGRKIAQASSTCISAEEAERCARAASRLADLTPASRAYDSLPHPLSSAAGVNNLDPRVVDLQAGELNEIAMEVAAAASDRGVKVPKGMVRAGSVTTLVLNSNGVDIAHDNTLVYSEFGSMADGPSPGEGVKNFTSPRLSDLDLTKLGAELAEQAKAARDAKALKGSSRLPVLICPGELGEMFDLSVGTAASGESVNKKRSPWTGMEGKEVSSRSVTVLDDPTDPRAVLSAPYDDEGVPASPKKIIEDGVLRTFLYDSYNAAVAGKRPSGNGVRRSAVNSQYQFQFPLTAGHLNLVVEPGARSRDEMIASLDEGAVVEKFAHPDVNGISGAFALEVRLGHLVKNGSVVSHFKHALLVGNMYEALRNVLEIGNDPEAVGSVIVPSMVFDGLELVGAPSISPHPFRYGSSP